MVLFAWVVVSATAKSDEDAIAEVVLGAETLPLIGTAALPMRCVVV